MLVAVASELERVSVLAVPRSTAPLCPACRNRSDSPCRRRVNDGSSALRVARGRVSVEASYLRGSPRRAPCPAAFYPSCRPGSAWTAEPTPDRLVIHVRLRPRPTCCLGCRGHECRPHGSYERTSADLPWQGRPVFLRRAAPTILDPYRADLEARWQAGCHNAAELARALIRTGADVRPRVWCWTGRRSAAARPWTCWMPCRARRAHRDGGLRQLIGRRGSCRRTRALWARWIDASDRRFLEGLCAEAPALVESAVLANRLADLVRRRSRESVEAWLAAASATPLAGFAAGLQHDVEALRGTTTTPWSTGPVEGQIGRLKMLKRMMFGRAGFALLRQRVLARF